MRTGTVKFFNNDKGFGFITDNETNEDIFVHKTGIVEMIRENDEVTFNTQAGQRGLNAVDVRRN